MTATAFRAIAGDLLPLPDGKCCLLTDHGPATILTQDAGAVFSLAHLFADLEAHVRRIAAMSRKDEASIRVALGELIRAGAVVEQQEWLSSFARPVTGATAIRVIGITTRQSPGRWAVLERCIRSFAENALHFGHTGIQFVIADDAPEPEVRQETRCNVKLLEGEYPAFGFAYLGREEKLRMAGNDPVLSFLLTGEGYPIANTVGANRNSVLIFAPGEPVLFVDDDVSCQLSLAPEGRLPGFRPDSGEVFEGRVLLPDPQALPPADAFAVDIVREFEQVLGPAARDGADWSGAINTPFLRTLEDPRARVILAQAGLAGDCGNTSPLGTLVSIARAAQNLTEADYRTLVLSRIEHRVNRQWHFSPDFSFMTYCAAIDRRHCGHFFPPVARAQDAAFADVLRAYERAACIAFAPFAVRHEPPEVRRYQVEMLYQTERLRLNEVLSQVVRAFPSKASDGEPRLKALAIWLEELGTDARELREFVGRLRTEGAGAAVRSLEGLLKAHGSKPAWWARDLQKRMRQLEKDMANGGVMADIVDGGVPVEWGVAARYVRSYARSLTYARGSGN